jgi:hypothetical protein
MYIVDFMGVKIELEMDDASHLGKSVNPHPSPKILGNFIGKGDAKGCTFTELKRRGDVSLYLRQPPYGPTYEVVRVQSHKKDRYASGKLIARAGDEFYPSSASFGDKGWYYPERPQAEAKFKELTETLPILTRQTRTQASFQTRTTHGAGLCSGSTPLR